MKKNRIFSGIILSLAVLALAANGATRKELEVMSREALEKLFEKSSGAEELAADAYGILVFPKTVKAGFGIGGEYGEGVLFEGKAPERYYSIVSGSIGFQIGAQVKSQVILFMTEDAYRDFKESEGWKAGVDGSVAIASFGAAGAVDTKTSGKPVIGFVFGNKGLMYNLNFEGSKISRIKRDEKTGKG
jgi:lipid-binding SYLF domain-containing protein